MTIKDFYKLKKDDIWDYFFEYLKKIEYAFNIRILKILRPEHHILIKFNDIHQPANFEIEIKKTQDNKYIGNFKCVSENKFYETLKYEEFQDVDILIDDLMENCLWNGRSEYAQYDKNGRMI